MSTITTFVSCSSSEELREAYMVLPSPKSSRELHSWERIWIRDFRFVVQNSPHHTTPPWDCSHTVWWEKTQRWVDVSMSWCNAVAYSTGPGMRRPGFKAPLSKEAETIIMGQAFSVSLILPQIRLMVVVRTKSRLWGGVGWGGGWYHVQYSELLGGKVHIQTHHHHHHN